MTNEYTLTHLTDERLLSEIRLLAARERESTARFIESLAELDVRRLYLAEGYTSLFTYCTLCLHLSEHAAYSRIEAARLARKFPTVLDLLADGSLTLTTLRLLGSLLTDDNHRRLLAAARHQSKREIERQVAALHPLAAVPSTIRKLPTATAPLLAAAPPLPEGSDTVPTTPSAMLAAALLPTPATVSHRSIVTALAPERYKVQLTVSRETHDRLRRVQDLLRHSVPDGDPAVIFDRALTLLLADLEKKKLAMTDQPRPRSGSNGSRHVPAAVKREVWGRDAGQCAFVGTMGRCAERGFLQFHHVVPFSEGGETTTANLQLRCRAHNAHEAREYFREQGWSLLPEECQTPPGNEARLNDELSRGQEPSASLLDRMTLVPSGLPPGSPSPW